MTDNLNKRFDVVALGELLVDFASHGASEQNNELFEACPGGAPCNALAMLSRLGKKTAFIGKVGDDYFGHGLVKAVRGAGINADAAVFDKSVRTTLAFVSTDDAGERSFAFFRNPGADMMLKSEEVDMSLVRDCRIFHFGTLSSTSEVSRAATRAAVAEAKKAGALISFDPNLRIRLWEDAEDALAEMAWGAAHCDILKISDDEAEFLVGDADAKSAARKLASVYPNVKLIFVTCGKEGSSVFYKGAFYREEAFLNATAVDTTGAGDTFCGCCLGAVLEQGIENLDEEKLRRALIFANAAASIVTTRKGALLAMPQADEVERLIKSAGRE